jgi:hypothetical protein
MALVDALGNLIRFVLLPGQRHDSIGVEPLIADLDFEALIGDKAFDNNWPRANLKERGATAVIPSMASRAGRIPHDAEMYKWRQKPKMADAAEQLLADKAWLRQVLRWPRCKMTSSEGSGS